MKPFFQLFLLCLLVSLFHQANAQTLEEVLQELEESLQEVSDDKVTHIQTLSFDAGAPYKIAFTVKDIALKGGKEKTSRYELNLADVDDKSIKRITTTKMMGVSVRLPRSAKEIKYLAEGRSQRYVGELKIFARDSENLDVLERLLKEAVELAKPLWLESLPPDFETVAEALGWINERLGKVSVGDDVFVQSITQGRREDLVRMEVDVRTSKGSAKEIYQFSLADLLENQVAYKIQSNQVMLEGKTRQNINLIHVERDGIQQNYASIIQLYFAEIDEAKRMVNAWKQLVVLAEKSLAQVTRSPGSLEEAWEWLGRYIQPVNNGNQLIAQKIRGDCAATFEQNTSDDKKQEQVTYTFDFGDFDERKTALMIKGIRIYITIKTLKDFNYVQTLKDGLPGNYTNSLSIEIPDVETARFLEPCLQYIIQSCESQAAVLARDFEWMASRMAAYSEDVNVSRSLTRQEAGNDCKFFLNVITQGRKGLSEELYEFNLKDIDPMQIDLKVKGAVVMLEIVTRGKQKLINYTRDGKPIFVDQLSIPVAGIQNGKVFRETLKAMTAACQ